MQIAAETHLCTYNRQFLATFSSLSVSRKTHCRSKLSGRFVDLCYRFCFFFGFSIHLFLFFRFVFLISVTVELYQCHCNETNSLSKSKNRKKLPEKSKYRTMEPVHYTATPDFSQFCIHTRATRSEAYVLWTASPIHPLPVFIAADTPLLMFHASLQHVHLAHLSGVLASHFVCRRLHRASLARTDAESPLPADARRNQGPSFV